MYGRGSELAAGALGARERGRATFDALYRDSYSRLVRLVAGKTGDRALAEDVAQETLLRAFSKVSAWDERPLWPWLRVIAVNLSADVGRKRSREVSGDPDGEGLAPGNIHACDDAILLEQMMARLPDRQRVAVSLRYLRDWTRAEAASFLGVSVPAFDQLLFRARRKLRVEYARLTAAAADETKEERGRA